MKQSQLQKIRYTYEPKLPPAIRGDIASISLSLGEPTQALSDQEALKKTFAHTYGKPIATMQASGNNPQASVQRTVGVILSGGQAPGGHNVISGIFDALKKANPQNKLLGFLGGPSGLVEDQKIEITAEYMNDFRNTGGFDIIGSGRTKIETPEQFAAARKTCQTNKIDALVVIGGDDSNTNAALLAEYFVAQGDPVQVIGVPKTIDGDLKNEYIEASFGFDTAVKTYSELIGNIQRDANSAKKYWHFIKLMGRSASHIALECALQTRPTACIISEEVAEKKQTLQQIVSSLAEIVAKRAEGGENFGVVLIPEGLIEFIPEMGRLISEVNDLLAIHSTEFSGISGPDEQARWLSGKLSTESAPVFTSLPRDIQHQLLMDRDPHGNVQVSRIETEKLLIQMVSEELNERARTGSYQGIFNALNHFFGYEGRCAFPSNFDADYTYSLGYSAFVLIANGLTGYLSSVRKIAQPASEWVAGGIPLTMMMNMEQRHGEKKPVIKKALVELEGAPFTYFARHRDEWATRTSFVYPGAIQYYGPDEICNQPTITLRLEQGLEA
ncbi:pyrophosphate--fructose-6-phosphate 1-phosphotransferase [Alkalispirochaeta americana]|uniref:Pyrophosphate--fructose 6-phosphate 1-phosphotransferase n=1 Tax=Alkalispirochaeta americana TaxID=159291 RepID=A0A1N6QYR8_9SPIO|nr:diphosphate--fructose-6-phosphate 1-phosphotransferase [Alkalispirochaeta americana]SIQ21735.1 pyrophosphate--fructose-6-phosphate 1-phosphotransferase [Alkalispirochaeta americana]